MPRTSTARRRVSDRYVTHGELDQLERRLQDRFDTVLDRLDRLDLRIGAWGRWFRERATRLVDGLVSKAGLMTVAVVVTYLLTR